MSEVKFIKTTSAYLDSLPIVDGQLIVLTDESGCYYDMGSTRFPITSGSTGGGHVIEDADGTDMTQRANLQFTGYLEVSDDASDDRTVVSVAPTTVEWSVWKQMTDAQKEGTKWLITGAPGTLPEDTAIFILKNQSLTFTNKVATVTDSRITAGCYPLVYWSDATYAAAQAAGVTAATSAGTITFTATSAPSTNLVCDIVFIDAALVDRTSASNINYDNTSSGLNATDVQGAIDELAAIDVSNSFSASNSAVHISATKRGNRVTLTASGYGSSFGNGTAIYINDGSLAPNTSSGTYLGGGSGVSISTQQYVYTIGQYTYNGTTHIIDVFHSQNIAVDALQYSVTYETA